LNLGFNVGCNAAVWTTAPNFCVDEFIDALQHVFPVQSHSGPFLLGTHWLMIIDCKK